MSFSNRQGIVPQLHKPVAVRMQRVFAAVLPVVALGLGACSTVEIRSERPMTPNNLDEAQRYMAGREKALEVLDYELNRQERACYKRFFVSSCVDQVRLKGAELRRAHLEVQGKAEDVIRLVEYGKRQEKKTQ